MWLIASPRTSRCNTRREIADELIHSHAETLEVNARKFASGFHCELTLMAVDGLCGPRIWALLTVVAHKFKFDVQYNESINKTLSLLGDRAPSSSLELVSARVTIKDRLGKLQAEANTKWSETRKAAGTVMDECMDHQLEAAAVLRRTGRWAPPPPLVCIQDSKAILGLYKKQCLAAIDVSGEVLWAVGYARKLAATLKINGQCCYHSGPDVAPVSRQTVYFPVDQVPGEVVVLVCTIHENSAGMVMDVDFPLTFTSMLKWSAILVAVVMPFAGACYRFVTVLLPCATTRLRADSSTS